MMHSEGLANLILVNHRKNFDETDFIKGSFRKGSKQLTQNARLAVFIAL